MTEKHLVKISEVKPNPNNPRVIRDDKFKKLVKSIQEFPEMLSIREIVVDENMIVLGGNMRLRALKEAGVKEVPVKQVNLTEEQKREFIIKDNLSYGEWDWEELGNVWDQEELSDWGMDIKDIEDIDFDGIEGNEDRKKEDKVKKVSCPECGCNFDV